MPKNHNIMLKNKVQWRRTSVLNMRKGNKGFLKFREITIYLNWSHSKQHRSQSNKSGGGYFNLLGITKGQLLPRVQGSVSNSATQQGRIPIPRSSEGEQDKVCYHSQPQPGVQILGQCHSRSSQTVAKHKGWAEEQYDWLLPGRRAQKPNFGLGCSESLNLAEAQKPDSILPSLAYSSPFLLPGVRWRALLWSRAIAAGYPWALCGEWSQLQQLREGALQRRLGRGCHQAAQHGPAVPGGTHHHHKSPQSVAGGRSHKEFMWEVGDQILRGSQGKGPAQAGLPGAASGLRTSPAGGQGTAGASCSWRAGSQEGARAAGPPSGRAWPAVPREGSRLCWDPDLQVSQG